MPASVPPAHAEESLIDSDPAVVRARAEVEAAQQAAHEAESSSRPPRSTATRCRPTSPTTSRRSSRSTSNAPQLAQQRDTLLDHLRQRAVALYAMGSDGASAADIFSGSVLDGARRKQLGDAASRSDHENAEQLEETRKTLADTRRRCARSRTRSRSSRPSSTG